MRKNPYTEMGFQLLTTSVAIILMVLILIKPFTSYFASEDTEPIEMSVNIDENDFEEEVVAEYHPDFLFYEIAECAYSDLDERMFGLSREKAPLSIYSDILIPPPKF